MSEEADDMPRDNDNPTTDSGVYRLPSADKAPLLRQPKRRRAGLLDQLDRDWKALVILGAAGGAAIAGYKMLSDKASAASVEVIAHRQDRSEMHEAVMDTRMTNLENNQHWQNDVLSRMAFAQGVQVQPTPTPVPSPHPTPEGTGTP